MLRSLLVVALVSCVALAACGSIDPKANDTVELRVKRLVDHYRAQVGLPAVTLDAKLSKGCMEHARYMRLNKDSDAVAGLNAHQQRPNCVPPEAQLEMLLTQRWQRILIRCRL